MPTSLNVIPIDAAGAGTGAIVRIVDYSVNDCGKVTGDTDNQATWRKFLGAQMHLAALTDEHGGDPIEV